MISIDTKFPDLENLKMNDAYITSSVKDMREIYSFHAMMLIYPFRTLNDLKDNVTGLFWSKFIDLRKRDEFSCDDLNILQNIQDQIQCKKLQSYGDILSRSTEEPEGDGLNNSKYNQEEEDYTDFDRISNLIEAQDFANDMENIYLDNNSKKGSFHELSERHKISNEMLVNADVGENHVFSLPSSDDCDQVQRDEHDKHKQHQFKSCDIPLLIEFVIGALLRCESVSRIEEPLLIDEENKEIISMNTFTKMNNLDFKQTVAFEVICSTFILDSIRNKVNQIFNIESNN